MLLFWLRVISLRKGSCSFFVTIRKDEKAWAVIQGLAEIMVEIEDEFIPEYRLYEYDKLKERYIETVKKLLDFQREKS